MNVIDFAGYASVFNTIDKHKDVIQPGAFKKTIEQFGPNYVDLLFRHDLVQKVGKLNKIEEDSYGLYIEGFIDKSLPNSQELINEIKNNNVLYFSIGYYPKSYQKKGNIKYISDVDLVEVSFVEFPANTKAKILNVDKVYMDQQIEDVLEQIKFMIN